MHLKHPALRCLLPAVAVVAVAAPTATAATGIQVGAGFLTASGVIRKNAGQSTCDVQITFSTDGVIAKTTSLTPFPGEHFAAGSIRNCRGSLLNANGHSFSGGSIRYHSFIGTLPNITGIRLVLLGVSITLSTLAGNCTYGGDLSTVTATVAGGVATGVDFSGSAALPRVSGSALCPSSMALSGALTASAPVPSVRLV